MRIRTQSVRQNAHNIKHIRGAYLSISLLHNNDRISVCYGGEIVGKGWRSGFNCNAHKVYRSSDGAH